jgi:imidazolonepropionase-like amidohydrolase
MTDTLLHGVTVLDCTGADPVAGLDVLVSDGRIAEIGPARARRGPTVIDGGGLTLMPGLTDAHVHFAMIGATGGHGSGPWVSQVLQIKSIIERALSEGFTTIRDAGGLEPAYARSVELGEILGPRILPSGSVISQTGGHGDMRQSYEGLHHTRTIPGLVAVAEVVDGPDEMRRAAREQLRRGATQIKIFASGGVLSPTDPFDSIQFSCEEIAAAVEVAESWHTYVLAHVHTSPAINNALDGGVRSIEHGSLMDAATAERVAQVGAYVVPTLLILEQMAGMPEQAGFTQAQRDKLKAVESAVGDSIRTMVDAGVKVGSGSDIVGLSQASRARELVLKGRIMGNHEAILSATKVNAELFRLEDRIGTIEVGKDADLILVDGQPIDDLEFLADPERVRMVMRQGVVVKDLDSRWTP